jgi:hypothetical protein
MNTLPKLNDQIANRFKIACIRHTRDYSSYQVAGDDFVVAGWSPKESDMVAARLFQATHGAGVKAVGIARNAKHVAARIKSSNPDNTKAARKTSHICLTAC